MKLTTELRALGARFGIEESHVAHVASLSMDLFDRFPAMPGIQKSDRAVLQAAAWLHDIGYAADPADHVEAGVRILLENPPSAFSSKDWNMVAGIVLLHRRDWRPLCEHELLATMGSGRMERVKMLASILRIADGLDHGHLQDARIISCRSGKRTDRIGVDCGWYAGNLSCAVDKSDLWESVFKRHLWIEGEVTRSNTIFKNVVVPADTAAAAARRILYSQYDVMHDMLPGMRGDESAVGALHYFRIALRRFRMALKLFAPLMKKTGRGRKLERKLGKLSDQLGPVRDAHVLWEFFSDPEQARLAGVDFLETVEADRSKVNQVMVGVLDSASFEKTMLEAKWFLRVEMAALERDEIQTGFKPYIEERLAAWMKGLLKSECPGPDTPPEPVHDFRKRCRKVRYCAEFAEPLFGKSIGKKVQRLKEIASALGEVRDARALYEKLQSTGCDPGILDELDSRQRQGWARFSKDWNRLIKSQPVFNL